MRAVVSGWEVKRAVFKELAARILGFLEGAWAEQASSQEDRTPPPLFLDTANGLKRVETFEDLLDALAALDRLVCAYVTLELSRYSPSVPIAAQDDRSPAVYRWASVLFEAYRRVLADAADVVWAPKGDLAVVAGRITIDDRAAASSPAVKEFLTRVRGFVLLSLWVASRSDLGKQFVTRLARSNAAATVQVQYKGKPSSLLAYVGGPGCHCKALGGDQVTTADIRCRAGLIAEGAGDPSILGAPVWLPEQGPVTLMDLMDKGKPELAFDYQRWGSYTGPDAALARILSGSVSFTRDRAPFYAPPRIDLLHELIHVLHNATGANREKVMTLTDGERHIFTTAEEYWTIVGGAITENGFNASIGAPDRASHGGLPLSALQPADPEAVNSFHALSRLGAS
jgi:hypothetical protein